MPVLRAAALVAAIAGFAIGCVPDRLREERGSAATRGVDAPAPTSTRKAKRSARPAAEPPAAPAAAATRAAGHLALGTPRDADPSDDLLLVKPEYALSYNARRNVANWVGWRLVGSDFGPTRRHKGKFITDESLPPGMLRVGHDDYSGSGFDRGHMCRSEDRTSSEEANRATFVLTNILPQRHELNAGPWLRLEELAQDLAQKQGRELYVVAGGIYEGPIGAIGRGVAVPSSFFKILVVIEPGETPPRVSERTRVVAVVMPNVGEIEREPWARYRTSVDEVERRTGYDFLTDVPEDVQRVIEARVGDAPAR